MRMPARVAAMMSRVVRRPGGGSQGAGAHGKAQEPGSEQGQRSGAAGGVRGPAASEAVVREWDRGEHSGLPVMTGPRAWAVAGPGGEGQARRCGKGCPSGDLCAGCPALSPDSQRPTLSAYPVPSLLPPGFCPLPDIPDTVLHHETFLKQNLFSLYRILPLFNHPVIAFPIPNFYIIHFLLFFVGFAPTPSAIMDSCELVCP